MPSKATSTQNTDNADNVTVSGSVTGVVEYPDYAAGTASFVISAVHKKGGGKFCVETEDQDIQKKVKKGDRAVMRCHLDGGDNWHVPVVLDTLEVISSGMMDLLAGGEVTGTRGKLEYATSKLSDLPVTLADGTVTWIKVYSRFYDDVEAIEVGKKVKVTFSLHTHTYNGEDLTRLIMTGVEEVA
jgi:hypothetical protein